MGSRPGMGRLSRVMASRVSAYTGVSATNRVLTLIVTASLCVSPAVAEVQHPDFFTSYALQSGQHYSTRPPWQVAGVDFPVGAPPDGLRDPLAAGVLPAGCKYLPNRNWVSCSGADVTLDRFDFSLHDCVAVVIDPRLTGTVTISNSRFADGPGCEFGPGSSLVVSAGVTSANLVFSGNDVDGKAGDLQAWPQCNPVGKCMSHNVMWRTSGSVTIENNAFLNTAARAVEAEVGESVVYRGNYIEGIWGNTAHAEFQLANSRPGTTPTFLLANNTFLQPPNVPSPSVYGWDVVTVFSGAQFSSVTKTRNVFVSNHAATATIAWLDLYGGSAKTATSTQNYYNSSGAFGCFGPAPKPANYPSGVTYSGNVDLLNREDPAVNTGNPYCFGRRLH